MDLRANKDYFHLPYSFFVTVMDFVYCVIRTESLYTIQSHGYLLSVKTSNSTTIVFGRSQ